VGFFDHFRDRHFGDDSWHNLVSLKCC
jgi:hypothetical protein